MEETAHLIIGLVFCVLLAFLWAKLEINVEGKHGFAEKLPCWRDNRLLFRKVLGGPLTGYHFYLWTFLFAMFHLPFILYLEWSLKMEFLTLGLLAFTFILEDFFWFVFNPNFTIEQFLQGPAGGIWWQPQRIGPLPACYTYYAIGIMVFFALYLITPGDFSLLKLILEKLST